MLACLLFCSHEYSEKSGYYVYHSKVACGVTAVKPISVHLCWCRLFEASFQLKMNFYHKGYGFVLKEYGKLYVIVQTKWLWTSKEIIPVSVTFNDIRGPSSRVADAYGNRRQLRWSATYRYLIYINTPAWWVVDNIALIDFATPRWRPELSEVVRTSAASVARLQSSHLLTIKRNLKEPANWL